MLAPGKFILFDDDLTTESAAHNYAAVDPELIVIPSKVALNDARIPKAVQVGGIVSESGTGGRNRFGKRYGNHPSSAFILHDRSARSLYILTGECLDYEYK